MTVDSQEIPKLLALTSQNERATLLISNGYEDKYGKFEVMMGAGVHQLFDEPSTLTGFDGLAFGHVAYSYKNRVYRSLQQNIKGIEYRWPHFSFYQPEHYYLRHRDGSVTANIDLSQSKYSTDYLNQQKADLTWDCSDSKLEYLEKIEEIKECILNGVFYEMNYCMEYSADSDLNPYALFLELNRTSPAPFSAFYKDGDNYMIGGSPERFLTKRGNRLISQPIKGTMKRSGNADEKEKTELFESEKDKAENIMIVDLVRNDLSKVSQVASVKVDELCGIYSYPNVHQMISTVSSELMDNVTFDMILEATFPMGSMTGAPKIEVMKHIDRLESFQRNLYSGSIGYFYQGDFDLNVVIRSVEYYKGKLFHAVGGAITYDSDNQEEYEECQTKAQSIRKLI